ncbi:MbtH family protein [Streptomyces sp. JH002]|jgi:MbtH protein|uniref:MbtH family protein n=1 Tax=Streptomyces TaxID=1883 RepID=UPI0036B631DF
MNANPFEDESADYLAVVNAEGQHSLWPAFAEVPPGWNVVAGPAGREDCLRFITENWQDMRPKSLVAALSRSAG